MTYKTALLKRKLEQVIMFPFVLLGKLFGKVFPMKNKTSFFFFFPNADLGGAIKVNADIAECFQHKNPLIVFSKKPKNNGYKHLFSRFNIIDLHKKIDTKFYHFVNFFYRGVLSAWINAADNPVVLGGESLFFYKIIPHLKKKSVRIDVCHLDTWFPYSIGFIDLITSRVFSTAKLMEVVSAQYDKNLIAKEFYSRLSFIENKIDIPPYLEIKNEKLEVLFVGRGAPQKRVHLIAAIAAKANELNLAARFSFVGDVHNIFDIEKYPFCKFYGNVKDEELLKSIYQQSDVLILTSSYEGLPLVVMQMMAHGKVILSTAVNSIPDYIKHLQNGLLIDETEEDKIIQQGVEFIQFLIEETSLRKEMGLKSRAMAIKKFSGEAFCKAYSSIISQELR